MKMPFCVMYQMNDQSISFKLTLRILNWNVRGLGDGQKCDVIKDIAKDANPDLLAYQETKWCECSIFRMRQVCPSKFKHYATLDADGTKGGILLVWSSRFTQMDSFALTYSLTVMLTFREINFMCTVVYGPQEEYEKIHFLRELKAIRNWNDLPWLLIGDFNLLRDIEDTTRAVRNLGSMMEFNNFIADANLIEAPLRGRTYTWSSKRPVPTFSKLDRAFISYHWNSSGASYDLKDLPTTASDHAPLLLTIKPHSNPIKRRFRFETFWLKYPEI